MSLGCLRRSGMGRGDCIPYARVNIESHIINIKNGPTYLLDV